MKFRMKSEQSTFFVLFYNKPIQIRTPKQILALFGLIGSYMKKIDIYP